MTGRAKRLNAGCGYRASAQKPPFTHESPDRSDPKMFFASWNQGDKYHLAIVLVGGDDSVDGPHYIPHPFKEEPGWGVSSVNYSIPKLLLSIHKNLLRKLTVSGYISDNG